MKVDSQIPSPYKKDANNSKRLSQEQTHRQTSFAKKSDDIFSSSSDEPDTAEV